MQTRLFLYPRGAYVIALASLVLSFGISAAQYQWVNPNPQNTAWTDKNNWEGGDDDFPNAAGVVATISNLTFANSGSISIGQSTVTVGTLNIDVPNSNQSLQFTGGGASQRIIFQGVGGNPAALNKSGAGAVRFSRGIEFSTEATITVTGGSIDIRGDNLRGSGNISFEGSGGYTMISEGYTAGPTYSGNVTITNGGTLLVDGTFAKHSSEVRSITVADTGTLGGGGTIERATTIQAGGILSPGNYADVGVLTFESDLSLEAGSQFNFRLFADSTANRGENFSGVDVGENGTLTVDPSAVFNLFFDDGSVDFTSGFWTASRSWLVFDSTAAPLVEDDIFTIGMISEDANGQSFDITGGSFSLEVIDNAIYLQYSIPEPSASGLVATLAVVCALFWYRSSWKQ